MLTLEEKFKLATLARSRSYSPYSKFKVGAVAILKDDKTFLGCNVENASYGLCNCAERNAIFRVVCEGYSAFDIKELVILADTPSPVSPCGACRQVMSEFLSPDATITLFNMKMDVKEIKMKDLLPYAFEQGDLNAK